MAITQQSTRDTAVLARYVLKFSVVGALAGAVGGWQVETSKLSDVERAKLVSYTAGRALEWASMDRDAAGRPVAVVQEYRAFKASYPRLSGRMEAATFSALVFPWPLLGLLVGLGALTTYSKLNDFMSQRTNK